LQKHIPAVLMRGGTSRGLFFQRSDLPADPCVRDAVLLAAYGSPDPDGRQTDGVGGGIPTASKVAIISPSESAEYDVVYQFGQIAIDRPVVDYTSNCGNISAAVGPFAVDEGLVPPQEPVTLVRIHQQNTDTLIVAEVPVKNGRFNEAGSYSITGVPGCGARICLRFVSPGGAKTGKLFPTGNVLDSLNLSGFEEIPLTIIDAANPLILARAADLGVAGIEIEEMDRNVRLRQRLEAIRCAVAVKIGLARTPQQATQSGQTIPKIALVAEPQSYNTTSGRVIAAAEMDLWARIMSMGRLHPTYALSGAVATAGAAMIPGTVAFGMVRPEARRLQVLRIGHPGGPLEVRTHVEVGATADAHCYRYAELDRTARRLMEGHVLVPERFFEAR